MGPRTSWEALTNSATSLDEPVGNALVLCWESDCGLLTLQGQLVDLRLVLILLARHDCCDLLV